MKASPLVQAMFAGKAPRVGAWLATPFPTICPCAPPFSDPTPEPSPSSSERSSDSGGRRSRPTSTAARTAQPSSVWWRQLLKRHSSRKGASSGKQKGMSSLSTCQKSTVRRPGVSATQPPPVEGQQFGGGGGVAALAGDLGHVAHLEGQAGLEGVEQAALADAAGAGEGGDLAAQGGAQFVNPPPPLLADEEDGVADALVDGERGPRLGLRRLPPGPSC